MKFHKTPTFLLVFFLSVCIVGIVSANGNSDNYSNRKRLLRQYNDYINGIKSVWNNVDNVDNNVQNHYRQYKNTLRHRIEAKEKAVDNLIQNLGNLLARFDSFCSTTACQDERKQIMHLVDQTYDQLRRETEQLPSEYISKFEQEETKLLGWEDNLENDETKMNNDSDLSKSEKKKLKKEYKKAYARIDDVSKVINGIITDMTKREYDKLCFEVEDADSYISQSKIKGVEQQLKSLVEVFLSKQKNQSDVGSVVISKQILKRVDRTRGRRNLRQLSSNKHLNIKTTISLDNNAPDDPQSDAYARRRLLERLLASDADVLNLFLIGLQYKALDDMQHATKVNIISCSSL